jgi:choline dehydrogenase
MFFEAPGIGLNMTEVALSLGPDALRAPAGPLPADPADDAALPPELAGLKAEAERRLTEWVTTGRSLVSSSLYDAALWYSTGLGDGPKSSVDRPMVASPSSAPKPLQPAR